MSDTFVGARLGQRLSLESLDDRMMPSAAAVLSPLPAASLGSAALVRDSQGTLPALADSPQAASSNAHVVRPAAPGPQARLEVRYMEFVIDHHAMGVEMAELCVRKAVSADLKDLCGRIAADQSREIGQLQGYLKAWYGIDYQPQMSRGDQRQLDRLARLSGPEFDIELSRMFIRHHEQIIDRSAREHTRFAHPELVQFADRVIAVQSREIGEFMAVINSYRGHRSGDGSPDTHRDGFGDGEGRDHR